MVPYKTIDVVSRLPPHAVPALLHPPQTLRGGA